MPESLPGAPVERSASIAQQRHPVAVHQQQAPQQQHGAAYRAGVAVGYLRTSRAGRILGKLAVVVALAVVSHYWPGPLLLALAGLWLLLAVATELRRLIRPKQPPTSGQRAGRAAASYLIASRLARRISR